MSVIVNGMEMPKCCYDCPLIRASIAGDFYCVAGDGIEEDLKKLYEHRMADCSLVEIPTPHGRMVDIDKLIDECKEYMNTLDPESKEYARILTIKSILISATAETVIEAEGSEE